MVVKRYNKIRENDKLSGDLIEIQFSSWHNFLQIGVPVKEREPKGLQGVFSEVFPIEDTHHRYQLEFKSYTVGKPAYTPQEAIERGASYAAPLRADFRLVIRETEENKDNKMGDKVREVIKQRVYICQLPLMTNWGTFVINGVERVIVSQLRRAPGVYFSEKLHPSGKRLFIGEIIPYRGSWMKFFTDINDVLWIELSRRHKVLCTTLLRALGYENLEDILKLFFKSKKREIEKSLGYILAKNVKKKERITARAGERADEKLLSILKDAKVQKVEVLEDKSPPFILATNAKDKIFSKREALFKIYSLLKGVGIHDEKVAEQFFNQMYFTRMYDLHPVGRRKINRKFGSKETSLFLAPEDFLNVIRGIISLSRGKERTDDTDHLGNRHLKRVSELLEDQFRIAFSRLAWVMRERMLLRENTKLTPRTLVNTVVVNAVINKFFGTSQLSQFMEQTNPLAELTHKRRISRFGPGGLTRETAGVEARDIHHSQYGRICPIETPEGQNVGIITSLATYAKANEHGEIEAPYYKVENGKVLKRIEYLTADVEEGHTIAQANTPLDKNGKFKKSLIFTRQKGEYPVVAPQEVDYMDISPKELVSISTSLIPFLEHDDADRALMGSNMQRQAVPLLVPEAPVIGTGMESRVAHDSRAIVVARRQGTVAYADANEVIIRSGKKNVTFDRYPLIKFRRTNQDTCINQLVRVNPGDNRKEGDLIADGFSTSSGKLGLGKNVLVAFMPWRGYNFEDAIVISENLLAKDTFTSITIQEYEIKVRDTTVGPEEITSDIPNVPPEEVVNLDEYGIIRVGAEVESEDILVGKISPKGEREFSPEERLLQAIFGEKAQDVKDTSLRVTSGVHGVVIDVRILSRKSEDPLYLREIEGRKDKIRLRIEYLIRELKQAKLDPKIRTKHIHELREEERGELEKIDRGDEMPHGVLKIIKVYVAQRRSIMVGDKLSGRHGNKGTISKILPREDMPYLPDGTPVDIILNPLGVPSRMNIGQILETHLGWAARIAGFEVISPVFDGASIEDIRKELREAKLPEDGKTVLYDGQSGKPFEERVTVGYAYMMKLGHMVEDKMHARSIGSYALITQQPLGGKALAGGQRFGEMEVWALQGYGAAYILQEMLTIKSDDIIGRRGLYESIIKGVKFPEPKEPMSFNVLLKELNALCLETELIREEKKMPKIPTKEFRSSGI